jgi:hypothetical protein
MDLTPVRAPRSLRDGSLGGRPGFERNGHHGHRVGGITAVGAERTVTTRHGDAQTRIEQATRLQHVLHGGETEFKRRCGDADGITGGHETAPVPHGGEGLAIARDECLKHAVSNEESVVERRDTRLFQRKHATIDPDVGREAHAGLLDDF